jgi:hypothetical protein
MRHLLLIVAVFVALSSSAQRGNCKKITKKIDNLTGTITYRSPDLKYFTVIMQVKNDTFFSLLIHLKDDYPHFEATGAMVEFDDGTVLEDEHVAVTCVQQLSMVAGGSMSSGMSNSGRYALQGTMRILPEYAGKFMLHKIVKVSLHNVLRSVGSGDARKVMSYVGCLK